MPTTLDANLHGLNPLIQRVSLVHRFDTVVFNPTTHTLEIWRYQGCFQGEKQVILPPVLFDWIHEKYQFRDMVLLIGQVISLHCITEEFSAPYPYWAYRFV